MSDRELIDTDGENKAVRCFLMIYGTPSLTVGAMRKHMSYCGMPYWPAWVETTHEISHLTKYGAQSWLRHLFSLETTPTLPLMAAIGDAE